MFTPKLAAAVAAAAVAAGAVAPASARRAPGDTRPNIVLFHPDTIRAESLGTYGHPLSKTPNYDRLAARGVLFEQAHVQHTQCSPSRCAMMTGRYMHVYGHRTQTNLVKEWEDNAFAYLKAAGYTVRSPPTRRADWRRHKGRKGRCRNAPSGCRAGSSGWHRTRGRR
jgi:hypothetical protein